MSSSLQQRLRVVTLHTNFGEISVELYDAYAPRICDNFFELATSGKYDNTIFHRLVPGCIVQGGDTNQRGGESASGEFLDDEIDTTLLRHVGAGVVSSASAGPGLNSSQFYITLSPQPTLDGLYTIFGRVSFGMDTVERISKLDVGPDFKLLHPVRVTHCSYGLYPAQRRPPALANKRTKGTRECDGDNANRKRLTRENDECDVHFEPTQAVLIDLPRRKTSAVCKLLHDAAPMPT